MFIYTHAQDCASRSCAVDSVPVDFNPAEYPIIGRHFFGIEALRPIGQVAGEVAARVAADLKQQHQVGHLHSLGPRPVLEALKEVAAGGELDTVLADYAQLDLEVVVTLGGNRFPAVPIYEVRR